VDRHRFSERQPYRDYDIVIMVGILRDSKEKETVLGICARHFASPSTIVNE
jgi:hypothetical protein